MTQLATCQGTAKDSNGWSPLIIASLWGYTDVMELLLHYGAQVEGEDNHRNTPLFLAIRYRHIGAVDVLLHHGAQVDRKISNRDSPPISALKNWDTGAVEAYLLRNRHRSYWADDSNKQYKQGETLLQWALRNQDYRFRNLLLQNGAQVDVVDDDGKTLLALASKRGYAKAMKLLLDHGASMDLRDHSGKSPLDHALLYLSSNLDLYGNRRGLSTVHLLLKGVFKQM